MIAGQHDGTIDGMQEQSGPVALQAFKERMRLDALLPGRYSMQSLCGLFVASEIQHALNPHKVLREIRALEGTGPVSILKPPTQFQRAPLRGLWHKHYQGAGLQSLAIDVRQGLKTYGFPFFEEKFRAAQEAGEERFLQPEDVSPLVDDMVSGNLRRRAEAQRITGDWIIYAQHEGKNYYLCIGPHNLGDDFYRDQIDRVCSVEFPFLKDLLV